MPSRVTSVLYFLTAIATLGVGLSIFNSQGTITSRLGDRWIAASAILDLIVPTIFLLAGTSVFRTNDKPRTSLWITTILMLSVVIVVFVQRGLGWRSILAASGPLLSLAWILGSSVRQTSTIALVGTVGYIIIEGQDLILNLHRYWTSGGFVGQLLVTLLPPILVAGSLVAAVSSMLRTHEQVDV
jgi:hypothetical protein